MGMIEAKWVRVMCDYYASPLWGPDGCMEALDDLPVDQDLRARLEDWACWFDREAMAEREFDVAAFSRVGLALAREVKAQLPDWTVVYFDQAAAEARAEGAARETFEYEVGV